jgi:RNA polymerase sigma factor (sigma-70 family)
MDGMTGPAVPVSVPVAQLTATNEPPEQQRRSDCDANALRHAQQVHAPVLLNFLMRLTAGDRHRAEDILQETLVRAWSNPEARNGDGQWSRAWLFTVARRIAIDHIRAAQVRPTECADERIETRARVDDDIERFLDVQVLQAAVETLPERLRTVLVEEGDVSTDGITETLPDGSVVEYDRTGRIVREVLPDGTTFDQFTPDGKPMRATIPGQDGQPDQQADIVGAADGSAVWHYSDGMVVGRDAAGDVTYERLPDGTVFDRFFDGAPVRGTIRDPDGDGSRTVDIVNHRDGSSIWQYSDGMVIGRDAAGNVTYQARASRPAWMLRTDAAVPAEVGTFAKATESAAGSSDRRYAAWCAPLELRPDNVRPSDV